MTAWPKVRLGDVLPHRKEFITIDDVEVAHRFFAAKAEFRFAVFDGRLLKAAQIHGLTLLGSD